jgi:hypothetical protein
MSNEHDENTQSNNQQTNRCPQNSLELIYRVTGFILDFGLDFYFMDKKCGLI